MVIGILPALYFTQLKALINLKINYFLNNLNIFNFFFFLKKKKKELK
jgi:hypothetical protein